MLMWHTRQGLIKLSLPFFHPGSIFAEYQSQPFCRNLLSLLPFLSILSASSTAKTRLNAFCRNLLTAFAASRHWYDWFSPLFRVYFFYFFNLVRFIGALFFCICFWSAISGSFFLLFLFSPLLRAYFFYSFYLVRYFGCIFFFPQIFFEAKNPLFPAVRIKNVLNLLYLVREKRSLFHKKFFFLI